MEVLEIKPAHGGNRERAETGKAAFNGAVIPYGDSGRI